MLILTRKVGETIRIGNDVKLTVLEVSDGQVRLGIAAPKSIAVHREEIFYKIKAEADTPPGVLLDCGKVDKDAVGNR